MCFIVLILLSYSGKYAKAPLDSVCIKSTAYYLLVIMLLDVKSSKVMIFTILHVRPDRHN